MRGHLQCRDTLAGNEGCPLKTGTTVIHAVCSSFPCILSLCNAFMWIFSVKADQSELNESDGGRHEGRPRARTKDTFNYLGVYTTHWSK